MNDNMIDYQVIDKLLAIEEKIYKSFENILIFQNTSKRLFNKELNILKMLIRKEKLILFHLPKESNQLNKLYDYFETIAYNLKLENENSYIANRIYNILEDQISLLQDIEEDNEESLLEIDRAEIRIPIRNNIVLGFLKDLKKLQKPNRKENELFIRLVSGFYAIQYNEVFDELVKSKFEIDKIKVKTNSEMIQSLKINRELYKDILRDVVTDYIIDVKESLFDLHSDNSSLEDEGFQMYILVYQYLLKYLSINDLIFIRDDLNEDIKKNDGLLDVYNILFEYTNKELFERPNHPNKALEPNKSRPKVPIKLYDSLVELIKLEEKIYEVFNGMDIEKIENEKELQLLSSILDKEKELISSIKINIYILPCIEEMISKDIELFIETDEEDDYKRKLITTRLKNLLPDLYKKSISPTQSEKSFYYITQNHVINSLNSFITILDKCKSSIKNDAIKKIYKGIIFTTFGLLEDYVNVNGNYRLLGCFSDELTANSINMNILDYCFDKDDELSERGKKIAKELLKLAKNLKDDKDWALFEYKLAELREILKNINNEHIIDIIYTISDESDRNFKKSKKRILRRIDILEFQKYQ